MKLTRPAAESFGACCDCPGYCAGISSGCCEASCAPSVAPKPSDIAPAKKAVVKLAKKLFMDASTTAQTLVYSHSLTAWMMQGLCQTMRSPEFVYCAHN